MAQSLRQLQIPFMVTGSVASSLQGEPRATHDVDIVVQIDPSAARRLVAAFPEPEYYIDEHAILDAISRRGMFNMIDEQSGDKVDFWLLTDEPFDHSRFSRRIPVSFGGADFDVSTPEDTIVMKLRWAMLSGGSEKQFGDALRIYEVQRGRLDEAYMERWAQTLGIMELWNRVRQPSQDDSAG